MENNKKTTLKEFLNNKKQTLRGILVETSSKDLAVVMFGGFERSGTTEKKFKTLADKLACSGISSLRFDATDCGLSDGDFYDMTTESLSENLFSAYSFLLNCGFKKVFFVAHSLAACALSLLVGKINIEKAILIAPALNQRELLRLWFAQKSNKEIKIDWNNYKNYYQEKEFIDNLNFDLITKCHKLNKEYRLKNHDYDYSNLFIPIKNSILLIHGDNDNTVPLQSLNIDFTNKIIIKNGDHDLERPGIIEQWLDKSVSFLKE